ncbi:hypothetical protein M1C59_13935 [Gordonia terrae]|uniref:hypothetical protein n=1 Tax=Gordonia terrae TaxID=2055 RepID=UPI00200AC9A9|nr:hypothetical protein [Gordonia terrae]UPW07197.1 hypothetical protein M1C59_13935 [Gordonia terrae]
MTMTNKSATNRGSTLLGAADVERLNRQAEREAGDRIAASSVIRPAPTSPPAPQQHPPAPGLDDAGDLGRTITDLIRLDKLADAGSRARARIREEAPAVAEQQREAHQRQQRALVAEAWDAAAKRQRVPEIVERSMRWYEHERLQASADYAANELLSAVDARHAALAQAAVADAFDEIDTAVLDVANGALRDALQAHERLTLARVSVDADPQAIINSDDDGAVSASRLWSTAVSRWDEVQKVRAWVAAVLDRGFVVKRGQVTVTPPPRIPSGAFADTAAVQAAHDTAERRVQGSQFTSDAPRFVREGSAHGVLRWWCGLDEGSRPQPRGVSDRIDTHTSDEGSEHQGSQQQDTDTDQLLNDEEIDAW